MKTTRTKSDSDNYDDDYTADTEHDAHDTRDRRRLCHNRRGMGGHRRHEVPNNNDAFSKINLRYLLLMLNMILMHTLLGKLLLIKSLHVINFLRIHVLGLLLVSLLIFLLFGG